MPAVNHKPSEAGSSGPHTLSLAPGMRFNLLDTRWEDPRCFELPLVAQTLSRLVRFTGHGQGQPWSVLRHSLAGHQVALAICKRRESRYSVWHTLLWMLLHDAHEAFMGDISRPVQQALTSLAGGADVVEQLKLQLDGRIRKVYGIDPAQADLGLVGEVDNVLCQWEGHQLGLPGFEGGEGIGQYLKETYGVDPAEKHWDDDQREFCELVSHYQSSILASA